MVAVADDGGGAGDAVGSLPFTQLQIESNYKVIVNCTAFNVAGNPLYMTAADWRILKDATFQQVKGLMSAEAFEATFSRALESGSYVYNANSNQIDFTFKPADTGGGGDAVGSLPLH
jgi:hypothetical protein